MLPSTSVIGRYPCFVQRRDGGGEASGVCKATPSGIGGMSSISTKIVGSGVMHTFAPESAIEALRYWQAVLFVAGVIPRIVIGRSSAGS